MKKMKKVGALVLALGMVSVMSLTACGGDKGGDSSVDTGAAKGEQVTAEQWATAVTNSFAADNVTLNVFTEYVEEEDGWSSVASGVIKLANGMLHENMSYTETYEGMTGNYTDETYIIKEQGTYYEWYRDSIDTLEWQCSEYHNPEYSPTVQGVVFGDEWTAEEIVAMYENLEFDATTGEYSLFVEDEHDPFMMKLKIVNDKFYTLTTRMSNEYEDDSSVWYSEWKYVFVAYGTTTIDSLPNEDEGEEDGKSEEGNGNDEVTASGLTETAWQNAIQATLAQTNFIINGNCTMEAMGRRESGTETLVFEGEKLYHEEDTVTGVYRTYYGSFFDESYGYAVPYVWNWDSDKSSWDCAFSDIGVVTAEEAFDVLTFDTYIDRLPYAYDNAVYNSEKGCYVIDLASWISEWDSSSAKTGTLEITFANGKLASLKGFAVDSVDFIGETIEEYEYVINYGNAVVGNLPAVTI